MTVTTNEHGQQNMFAKEPTMYVENNLKNWREAYNGRWAMLGIISGFISYATTGKFFFGTF